MRLDGGARTFRQHWGYESRPLIPPPPLIEEDEAGIEPETVSLREANTASPIGESNFEFNFIILLYRKTCIYCPLSGGKYCLVRNRHQICEV